jgi:bacterioferritin B
MLISKKMNAALNEQVGHEMSASTEYLQIAAYFAGEGLNKLAGRFFAQSNEERTHALRLAKFIVEAGADLQIPALPAPRYQFKSPLEAVQAALDWEKTVTKQINGLADLAQKESDHLSYNTLTWFVKEQLEEVSSMENLLKLVQRAGNNMLYVDYTVGSEKKAEGGEADKS